MEGVEMNAGPDDHILSMEYEERGSEFKIQK